MVQNQKYPFKLAPLPYAYEALEPHIDAETMHYHHDKHLQTYIDNLNKTLADHPTYHQMTLAQLLTDLDRLPADIRTAVRNNAGGVYNHELYFDLLCPNCPQPQGKFLEAVNTQFGDVKQMLAQLRAAALGQFGSGFAWLILQPNGKLLIQGLPNQDNPMSCCGYPLLTADVWEHAYYLKYKNLRADYFDNWAQVINWTEVAARFESPQG